MSSWDACGRSRLSLGTVNPVNYVASAYGEHYFVFSEGYLTEKQVGSIHL